MARIAGQITVQLVAAGLSACVAACGPSVVDLGTRGGDGGAAPSGGAGVLAGSGGAGAAGLGPVSAAGAGSLAVGVSGAGSFPGPADAGAAPSPDGGVVGTSSDPSGGCGLTPPASDTTITVNTSSTNYIVDVPAGYDRSNPYPLVFSYRGANTTAAAFRRYLDLATVVGSGGIVVHVDCADGAATWQLQRDQLVFEALLAKLEASYCIDQRRVFVVGHETGAIFASVLACEHAGVLRGLGSLNGVAPMSMCTGGLAVWISQGKADMTRTLGRASRDFWLEQNHCDATMTAAVEPSPCLEFKNCEPAYPVRYCEYDGGLDLPDFVAAGVWNFLRGL